MGKLLILEMLPCPRCGIDVLVKTKTHDEIPYYPEFCTRCENFINNHPEKYEKEKYKQAKKDFSEKFHFHF